VGVCAQKLAPFAVFPAHRTPNALALYNCHQFPSRYRESASCVPRVVESSTIPARRLQRDLQPLAGGLLADGTRSSPPARERELGRAAHRPPGLAVTPDKPPEGVHPEAGADAHGLPTPPGATAIGCPRERMYHSTACVGSASPACTARPSDLISRTAHGGASTASLAAITQRITDDVPNPKDCQEPWHQGRGTTLPSDVLGLAAYLWALNHRPGR
jgi:hypothetical protein